jgi:hypothetical protein
MPHCYICKEHKEPTAFHKDASRHSGLSSRCKVCRQPRPSRAVKCSDCGTHPVRKATGKCWQCCDAPMTCWNCKESKPQTEFVKDPGKLSGLSSLCRECGRDKVRAYRKTPKGRAAERRRRKLSAKTPRGRVAKKRHKYNRRNREKAAQGTFSLEQLEARFAYFGNRCVECGTEENLTVDHTIPLARSPLNWPSNLRPMCHSCNARKGAS